MEIRVENSFAISQGEVGFTNNKSKKHILGTFGASPCVILACYNPNTKEAALAHIDVMTNVLQTISMISYQLTKKGNADLIVNLSTGQLNDNSTLESIKDALSSFEENMKISKTLESLSLAIDAKTGEVVQDITHDVLDLNGNYGERMEGRYNSAMLSFGKQINSQRSFNGRGKNYIYPLVQHGGLSCIFDHKVNPRKYMGLLKVMN